MQFVAVPESTRDLNKSIVIQHQKTNRPNKKPSKLHILELNFLEISNSCLQMTIFFHFPKVYIPFSCAHFVISRRDTSSALGKVAEEAFLQLFPSAIHGIPRFPISQIQVNPYPSSLPGLPRSLTGENWS